MDEMRIESRLMRSLAAKWLQRKIKKQYGYNVKIDLGNFTSTVIEGVAHVHLEIDAELNKDELDKFAKRFG